MYCQMKAQGTRHSMEPAMSGEGQVVIVVTEQLDERIIDMKEWGKMI